MTSQSEPKTQRSAAIAGARDSIPFAVLFIFVYASYGALCASSGWGFWQTFAATALLYSTPLQLILVQNIDSGLVVIPIVLAMNARFALMSATLSPYFRSISLLKFAPAATLMIPSVFTACFTRFQLHPQHAMAYFLGIGVPLYVTGVLATVVGYQIGSDFGGTEVVDLTAFILALLLVILSGKLWPQTYEVSAFWLGFLAAPVFLLAFESYNIVVTPFLIGGLLVLSQWRPGVRQ